MYNKLINECSLSQQHQCPVCLDTSGNFIESGCSQCLDDNRFIHKECLDMIVDRGFHINECYICKHPIVHVEKKESCIFITMGHMLCIFIFGFIVKFLYILICLIQGIKPDKYFLNPFSSFISFVIHFFIGSFLYIFLSICYSSRESAAS